MTACNFHELACRYAKAVDSRDTDALLAVFTADAEVVTPSATISGHDDLRNIAPMMKEMFESTQHRIHNCYVEVDGDQATGEVYCTACHVRCAEGKRELEEWSIRYQDTLQLVDGGWLFKRRQLIIDWVEVRQVVAYADLY